MACNILCDARPMNQDRSIGLEGLGETKKNLRRDRNSRSREWNTATS